MEYVNAALIVIGFLIIGYYQRQKIGALEKQLNSQKEILGNTKMFLDLFDLEKLKGFGEIVEKKVKMEMECQIQEMKTQFDEEHKKHQVTKENFQKMSEEYADAAGTLGVAMVYLPKPKRIEIIENLMEGSARRGLRKVVDKINQSEGNVLGKAINAFLYPPPPEKLF